MKNDGVDPANMRHSQRTGSHALFLSPLTSIGMCNVPGRYRHLILKPGQFDYEIVTYDDPGASLTATDMDVRLSSCVHACISPSHTRLSTTFRSRLQLKTASTWVYGLVFSLALCLIFTQVVIKMTLHRGTYATMLLRELTKTSTTQQYQKELQAKRTIAL